MVRRQPNMQRRKKSLDADMPNVIMEMVRNQQVITNSAAESTIQLVSEGMIKQLEDALKRRKQVDEAVDRFTNIGLCVIYDTDSRSYVIMTFPFPVRERMVGFYSVSHDGERRFHTVNIKGVEVRT